MKNMKKLSLPILTFILILSMTACADKVTKSPSPSTGTPSSSESGGSDESDKANDKGETNEKEESDPDVLSSPGPTVESLQNLYAKAPEYEYMAIGYYQDPFNPDMVRDGYVPYEEGYVQESTDFLRGKAHGISIRLHMTAASGATSANEELKQSYLGQLDERGLSFETNEITSYDNDTLAICPVAYMDENENPVVTFLYTDVRDDGTVFMCAEIEFYTAEFDDITARMLPEVEDVFAVNFSGILEFGEIQ